MRGNMTLEPVLIDGEFRESENPVGHFTAVDPKARESLPPSYPISGREDLVAALAAARRAADELRNVEPVQLADFLERLAAELQARANELVEAAHTETGLPITPRLDRVELPRTTGQLKRCAEAARDPSWRQIEIDTDHRLRTWLEPIGPVVVFGPNNFPFAFNGIAGGDFGAAIAAGNPVIAKANLGHPGTTKHLAEAALSALRACELPRATVQLLYHLPKDLGFELVAHRDIGATAFTGSRGAGLELKAHADQAGNPIYLELSSINPVFLLPGALKARARELAQELTTSCSLGAGQFCTNPGVSIVEQGPDGETFLSELYKCFEARQPETMLGPGGPEQLDKVLGVLQRHGARLLVGGRPTTSAGYGFQSTLLRATGSQFLENPGALQTEAFGVVHLVIVVSHFEQMKEVAATLEGNLTGCIYSQPGTDDDERYTQLEPLLRPRVGRLLNDKMPTGVAVSPAMHHGGPFPSTGHPLFTSVGVPSAMVRFAARRCYDNVEEHRLPLPLRNENPTGTLWRRINGAWTQASIS